MKNIIKNPHYDSFDNEWFFNLAKFINIKIDSSSIFKSRMASLACLDMAILVLDRDECGGYFGKDRRVWWD